jgi:L-serine deaminase
MLVESADPANELRAVREIQVMNSAFDAGFDESIRAGAIRLERAGSIDDYIWRERAKLRGQQAVAAVAIEVHRTELREEALNRRAAGKASLDSPGG